MNVLELFLAYADNFEKTYADDDWSRLEPHFCDDAVYEVKGDPISAKFEGPDAIFKAMKTSVDGGDRRFEGREIGIVRAPEVDGSRMSVGWEVTYTVNGHPPFVLRGSSEAEFRDGKIAYLCDSYDDAVMGEIQDWQEKTGFLFDFAYN